MAVLAPQDWHPPRDHQMDAPAQNSVNPSANRARSSPANDPSQAPSPVPSNHPSQPYPYPVQQPQGGWNAQAQPFYPAFYQNTHQQAYPIHPAHAAQQGPIPQQGPYFDPNAQFAQWAYQQMMFNAQQQAHQQQLSHVAQNNSPHSQRGRGANSGPSNDYFAQSQIPPGFNSFPSGTPPPPHPSQQQQGQYRLSPGQQQQQQQQGQPQYDGFHPYRRPNRTGSQHTEAPSQSNPPQDWRPPQGTFQPPYARPDANASSSSVNSSSSQRQRTNSLQGSTSSGGGGGRNTPPHHSNASSTGSARNRNGPPAPTHTAGGSSQGRGNGSSSSAAGTPPGRLHNRNASSSSTSSSVTGPSRSSAAAGTPSSSGSSVPLPRPVRPSPLSQTSSMSMADKRRSRDDTDLAGMMEAAPSAQLPHKGLKSRLRRALSLSAAQAISEEDDEDASPPKGSASRMNGKEPATAAAPGPSTSTDSTLQSNAALEPGDNASTATRKTKKRRALFNSRINASTDNISLSSTMSSASVVIRKLGSIGKLARRNSLAGITSVFKGSKKEKEEAEASDSKKGKKKKGEKGEAAEASVSYLTAEPDRVSSEWAPELTGLSPAAKLARQHTLKSNAEAAARAKQQEEAAAAAAAAATAHANGEPVPATWEKNTTTRQGESSGRSGAYHVNEEGMRVIVEDDDSASDGESNHQHDYSGTIEGWEEDDWDRAEDEEDMTIRQSLERASIGEGEEMEPWAVDARRSIERTRTPARGILKNADKYDQRVFMDANRQRSNSYNSPVTQHSELGPLARIPSPDPDHIDGLHRHGSHSSNHSTSGNGTTPTFQLPPFSFDNEGGTESPQAMSDAEDDARPHPEKTLFNHPNLNSSAPVLSSMLTPPSTLPRSATTPSKRLTFANNLHVYDTFPATVYDRRSEPATWSRLTPALAQRIKEELNSYKMEEMEVHASSRIHTQFFV